MSSIKLTADSGGGTFDRDWETVPVAPLPLCNL